MGKRKVLLAILMVTALVAVTSADEVISIDINNYGNDIAFSGEAAVPGAATWIAYEGGWGVPMGSPRSSGLAEVGQIKASTYAAQVWVADAGNHGYVTGSGTGLLDDGFVKNTAQDPNLAFIGADLFGDVTGQNFAYGGTFDVYVYGDSAGTFTLVDANNVSIVPAELVTGTVSGFVEGQNYVVFENIEIASPNSVRILYSNELNALQLVKKSTPKAIIRDTATTDPNDYTVNAPNYSVAHDTNGRDDEIDYGVGTYYGPDLGDDQVYMLDTDDWMEYDILIDAANQGQYNLFVDLTGDYETTLELYLDGNFLGTVTGANTRIGPVALNLFTGTHVVKWRSTGMHGGNVDDVVFDYLGAIVLQDCADIYTYGLNLAGDLTGDCRVNLDDLALIADEWTANYNPAAL